MFDFNHIKKLKIFIFVQFKKMTLFSAFYKKQTYKVFFNFFCIHTMLIFKPVVSMNS